ncbi:hypothetical protein ACS0TY_019244 [Phlomoides rotata]
MGLFNLHLDEFDELLMTLIDEFDYIILNAGHWFTHPAIYYESHRIIGCHFYNLHSVTDLPMTYDYCCVFRTLL